MLVKALVFPHFDYCSALFLDMPEGQMDRMSRCMNAAVRFFTGRKRWEHIIPDYISNEILKYRSRIKYICAVAERETRTDGLCLSVLGAATTRGQMSFAVGGARLWNSLPLGLREGFQRPGFGAGLRRYLLDLQSGS
ncbi:hypothetical protein TKK_0009358 [Trichogramma kaykai]